MEPWIIIPHSRPECSDVVAGNVRRQRRRCRVAVCEVGAAQGSLAIEVDVLLRVDEAIPARARNLLLDALPKEDVPVICMDDDDWYGPGYVSEALWSLHDQPKAEYVSKGLHFLHDLPSDTLYVIDENVVQMKTRQAFGCTIVHRSLTRMPRFDEDWPIGEDDRWAYTVNGRGQRGWRTSPFHFIYRVHGGQMMEGRLQSILNFPWKSVRRVGAGVDFQMVEGQKPISGTRMKVGKSPAFQYPSVGGAVMAQ